MRVYCCNCKFCYFSEDVSYPGDYCCELLLKRGRNFYRTFAIDGKCENKNKLNNCKDFKKKWFTIYQKEE